jgi:hypothetical protein
MYKRKIPSNDKLQKLFKKSIWVVPSSTLLAYKTVNNISIEVQDQTIWVIDEYKKGYIFGTAYVLINSEPVSKTTFIGSISPLGDVLISFYSDNILTSGQGKFVKKNCVWQFIMQMSTLNSISSGVIGLSHWSYMIKIIDKNKEYSDLPGIGKSVPESINLFKPNLVAATIK